MPLPSAFVEKNGSKMCGRSVSAMPWPVSVIQIWRRRPALAERLRRRPAARRPSGMACTALRQRFQIACRSCWGSTRVGSDSPYSRDDLEVGGQRCGARSRSSDLVEDLGHVDLDAPPSGPAARTRGSRRRCWLSRADSRSTISTSWLAVVVGRQIAGERLDRARDRRERVADLVRHVGGEAADGGQAVGLAHALLHLLDAGEILADADEPGHVARRRSAATRTRCRRAPPAVAPAEAELVARRRARCLPTTARRTSAEVDPVSEDRLPRLVDRVLRAALR